MNENNDIAYESLGKVLRGKLVLIAINFFIKTEKDFK